MLEVLGHESFHRVGSWVDAANGVYVGWSVPEGAFADCMPLQNEDDSVALVFSGEDFPEPGTVERLKQKGHAVQPHGPSYLVHQYEEDPTFLPRLNGRFHGLLLDKRTATATLFNDRYGMHRLYYHQSSDAFYFAAEAKAILAVRPELKRADPRGLGELISVGCVLENRSLFDQIQLLPGAAAWTFRNGRLDTRASYFQPGEWEQQAVLEPEAYYQEMRAVFSRNLPRYFAGRQKIGVSLTGGLDTRMVMAWQRSRPKTLPCYTFAGMFRDCHDVVVARKVARACGQPHEVIPVDEHFLQRFAHYAERSVYLTDGCTDMNLCPDLYVYEKARHIAPVRMTGNYGGEVLRRVRAFKPIQLLPGLFTPVQDRIGEAETTYGGVLRGHPLTFGAFKQAPWHHYGVLALEQTQLALRTPFLDNDLVKLVYRAPEHVCRSDAASLRLIADGDAGLSRIPTDRGVIGKSAPVIGRLRRLLLEFSFKAEYAYDYGMPQVLASINHRLSALRLERLFLGRHKFYHFRLWYRTVLADYVRDVLLDPRTLARPFIDRRKVEAVVNGHLAGTHNFTLEIHKLLTLELIHRQLLEQ